MVGQIVCWWNHGPTHPLPFAPQRAHQNKSYLGANTNNSKESQKSENKHTRKEQHEETSATSPSNISSNRRSGFSLYKTRVSLSGSKHWARFQASAEKTLFSWWFSVEDKDSDLPGDQIPGGQLKEEGGRHLETGLWHLGTSSWYFLQASKWGKCRCRNKVSTVGYGLWVRLRLKELNTPVEIVKRFKCLRLSRMKWKGFPLLWWTLSKLLKLIFASGLILPMETVSLLTARRSNILITTTHFSSNDITSTNSQSRFVSMGFANLTCLFVQISISKTSWPRQIQGVWSRHHGGLGQAQSPRLGGDIYFDAGERWAGDKCSLTTKNKYHRRLISHVLAFWKLFLPALPELHRQTI